VGASLRPHWFHVELGSRARALTRSFHVKPSRLERATVDKRAPGNHFPRYQRPLESACMTTTRPQAAPALSRELWAVAALTVIGGGVRMWSLGRIGLNHFDEGIYALAGLWALSPRGLQSLDPALIPYAPPGFPLLIGVAYACFGVSDVSAILVSIAAGTLTIPVTAWLARRTFGAGAGGAAAALAALSGPHVAFSRMALVDVAFVLCWLVALGCGQRFLERPGPARATALGLTVGLSQLFKYNGWTSGAAVALAAAVWMVLPEGRRQARASWGWGLLAVAVATAVYAPWFVFVENHGGYRALLAHQRGYASGPASWPGHLRLQLAQAKALCGGPAWLGCSGLLAAAALAWQRVGPGFSPMRAAGLAVLLSGAAIALAPPIGAACVLGLCIAVVVGRRSWTPPIAVVGTAWTFLAAITPFYRPYARLWLPVEAIEWLVLGAGFSAVSAGHTVWARGRNLAAVAWFMVLALLSALLLQLIAYGGTWGARGRPALEPSDSLKRTIIAAAATLPRHASSVRIYARPPVLFYLGLAGGPAVARQRDLAHLLEPGGQGPTWAVLDTAMLRQNNVPPDELDRLLKSWSIVAQAPMTLNLPTLLDIDPAAANSESTAMSAELWQLRRETVGNPR
jgi:dolichyl-phosphate-mannose-protein mannosyltransferase